MDIPITFDYNGKNYKGHFSAPFGAGGNVWFLTINKYHFGQLILTEHFGWRFASNSGEMEDLTELFARVVMAAYDV